MLTTEKDHVRLAGDPSLAALAARAAVLPVRLLIEQEQEDAFCALLLSVCARQHAG